MQTGSVVCPQGDISRGMVQTDHESRHGALRAQTSRTSGASQHFPGGRMKFLESQFSVSLGREAMAGQGLGGLTPKHRAQRKGPSHPGLSVIA